MAGELLSFSLAELITAVLAVALVILLTVFIYRAYRRSRITPEERERRRRAWLTATGKMGDATLVEVRDSLLFYSYDVRGVEYTASQDVSTLPEKVPSELNVTGPVSVKYDARNPANSIVVAEGWSGLR
ncbi:MAG TPA: DUF3592 domain-containing protein [Candidatus Acidoferrales bacterium]|nr:DUF3592 domain-containing protein [Candidatus Acidoferrales bacterium]